MKKINFLILFLVFLGWVSITLIFPPKAFATGSINGTTRNFVGNPLLPGVTVSGASRTTTTDAGGAWTMTDVDAGTYTFTFSKAGFTTKTASATIPEGASTTLHVQLVPTGSINGTTRNFVGNPLLPGVTVSGASRTTTTDAGGAWTMTDVDAGTYTFTFSKAGFANTVDSATIPMDGSVSFHVQLVPNCANTFPGTNQLIGCSWDGTNFNSADGDGPSGASLSSPVPDAATAIDQNWGSGGINPAVGSDTFSIRLKGNFTFKAGTYTFYAGADDGVRLKVDGVEKIDVPAGTSWKDQGYTADQYSASVTFSTQATHLIELEHYENTGDARVSLRWTYTPLSTPSPTPTATPVSVTGKVYHISGDLTINSNITVNIPGVIFVDGKLNINTNLTHSSNNAGLVFVVKGDVAIKDTVTQVDAVIISEGTIYTAVVPPATTCDKSSVTASQLIINGSLISLNSSKPIKFCRTLGVAANQTTPAEVVNQQPKYLVILKEIFSETLQKWSEIP